MPKYSKSPLERIFHKLFELAPTKEKIDWAVVVDLRAEVLLRRLNVRVDINNP